MKTCKNCIHYTGIQCHGHGEYWGECKKNKNTFFCFDDTPCLQDIKTMRLAYYEQKDRSSTLEYQKLELEFYKARYESRERLIQKYRDMLMLAIKYIPKAEYKKYADEQLEFLMNYKPENKENESKTNTTTSKQN